jgi:drug/metabolite transporter (DMT)-like permease
VAVYEVSYAKWAVPPRRSISFSLFVIGCIGVCSLLAGLAIFPLFHFSGVETFAFPPDLKTWIAIVVISVLGMAFNGLFMLVMTFTGPVVAAVGILASIPATSIVDVILTGKALGLPTIVGGFCILAGFLLYVR